MTCEISPDISTYLQIPARSLRDPCEITLKISTGWKLLQVAMDATFELKDLTRSDKKPSDISVVPKSTLWPVWLFQLIPEIIKNR